MTEACRIERLGSEHSLLAATLHATAMSNGTGDAAWDSAAFAALLELPGTFGNLACHADQPAGLVLARVAADEAEILTIAVLPSYRGRGIASLLMARAAETARIKGAETLFLEVALDNDAARALYERLGFAEVGRRRDYYRRAGRLAVDSLVLARSLANS